MPEAKIVCPDCGDVLEVDILEKDKNLISLHGEIKCICEKCLKKREQRCKVCRGKIVLEESHIKGICLGCRQRPKVYIP
jgi:hypothetical protein